jgi:hypothetical protein
VFPVSECWPDGKNVGGKRTYRGTPALLGTVRWSGPPCGVRMLLRYLFAVKVSLGKTWKLGLALPYAVTRPVEDDGGWIVSPW